MEGINTKVAHQDLVSFSSVKKMYCDAKSTLRVQPYTNVNRYVTKQIELCSVNLIKW